MRKKDINKNAIFLGHIRKVWLSVKTWWKGENVEEKMVCTQEWRIILLQISGIIT